MNLGELRTPCALVDLDVVERNTARMAERMKRLGVRIRPHVKTHKCVEAARLQLAGREDGITVSTLAEARFFADAGFRDITWAFPLPPDRLEDVSELGRRIRLNLVLDQEAALSGLERFAESKGLCFPVLLEVDCGDRRAGVDPESERAVRLARRLAGSECVDFRGLLTHGGHSYGCRNAEGIRKVASQERDVVTRFAGKLRNAGVRVEEVSVGSTPTMSHAEGLSGVTEARPGNYVFYDVFQASIGSCSLEDVGFSVLATVVGHYPEQNKLMVNAGALALSKDGGPRHIDPDCGYGRPATLDGRLLEGWKVVSISQEHGQIVADRPVDFAAHPVGSRLRILPNHSCLAAAQHDRYWVCRRGGILAEWTPCRGW